MRFDPKIMFIVCLSMMLHAFEEYYEILVIIVDLAMIGLGYRLRNRKWLAPMNSAQNFTLEWYFPFFVQKRYF